jgi:phosphatidylinositol-3-phosphatase
MNASTKHNPFISYLDAQSNPARVANIVDFSEFATDLASGNVPDYVWISPDQCNDMHGRASTPDDPCDFSQVPALIAAGDSFLLNTVGAIMNSSAWTGNSVIFIVWDESDFTGTGLDGFGDDTGCCDSVAGAGGGHVVMITISHSDHTSRTSAVAYNHYSMLSTIEGGWQLGCLAFTCDTVNVSPNVVCPWQVVSQCRTGVAFVATHTHFPALNSQVSTKLAPHVL